MAEQQTQEQTEHPGIKPEFKDRWKKYVDEAISNDPGEPRNFALMILAQVSTLIKGLDSGLAPIEVLKLIMPNTSVIFMPQILHPVVVFSLRGDEFRLWWNEWHDRVCPTDVPEPALDQMTPDQRAAWDRRWYLPVKDDAGKIVRDEDGTVEVEWQPAIFNPWQMNIVGRTAQLTGMFDPSVPLTKTPQYMEGVNALYKKFKDEAAAKREGAATA